jgi:hypothetical protein
MKQKLFSRFLSLVLCLAISIASSFGAFTHTTGTISGTDHSLVDMLDTNLVAAGWSIAFTSGTSIRVYRNGTGSSQRYWYVRDNGPNVTSTYKEAWIRGYGTKADANDTADASNTLQFPTAAQKTNGQVIRKSASADATARTYHMYADARTCILLVYTGDTAGAAMGPYVFGDGYVLEGSSALAALTACRQTENSATQTDATFQTFGNGNCYLMQSYTGAGGALAVGVAPIGPMTNPSFGSNSIAFPNGADGGRYLGQMAYPETSAFNGGVYRGRFRGLWYPLAGQSTYADLDTLSGSGSLAGRTFTIHKCGAGFYAIETSDTLESN